ncbi:hypothetical protein EVAR_22305_1 [Eumeta japonica]|uniref:Uncharacterized protein n=1 Tax=Eumeta variegata TaxID=151549 RepID=A0A4C1UAK5_EUMVA|nr:hypothetical protein EVAR_22305_1 [Eumeta japonica]
MILRGCAISQTHTTITGCSDGFEALHLQEGTSNSLEAFLPTFFIGRLSLRQNELGATSAAARPRLDNNTNLKLRLNSSQRHVTNIRQKHASNSYRSDRPRKSWTQIVVPEGKNIYSIKNKRYSLRLRILTEEQRGAMTRGKVVPPHTASGEKNYRRRRPASRPISAAMPAITRDVRRDRETYIRAVCKSQSVPPSDR